MCFGHLSECGNQQSRLCGYQTDPLATVVVDFCTGTIDMREAQPQDAAAVPCWKPVLFTAMAGGMGWGIRGQYGHETGAMIAGVLVSLSVCFILCRRLPVDQLARTVALAIVAMGIGGSMTYGETVGLTHDGPLRGNWDALRWGMLGLGIKGGIWISFFGLFLGMGLSGHRYTARNMVALVLASLGAYFIGINTINYPFNPYEVDAEFTYGKDGTEMVHVNRFPSGKGNLSQAGKKALPYLYFSDHWDWEPYETIRPRWENWGGQLLALLSIFIYVGWWTKDRLAGNLAIWGFVAGGIGFPTGQCVQAYYQWNSEVFAGGIWDHLSMNWWNTMETTFGTVMGAIVGLGAWFNRKRIGGLFAPGANRSTISVPIEATFIGIHIFCLAFFEFYFVAHTDHYNDILYEQGLVMAFIPFVLIVGGRFSQYLIMFPVVLQTIAGKTLLARLYKQIHNDNGTSERVYNDQATINLPLLDRDPHVPFVVGWLIYFIIPMGIASFAAWYFYNKHKTRTTDSTFTGTALLIMGWLFFYLNFAFWNFPWWQWSDFSNWPWEKWGGPNTMNALFVIYMSSLTCMVCLGCWCDRRRERSGEG